MKSNARTAEHPCSQCSASTGHFATHEDYAIKPDAERTPLLPAHPTDMDGIGLQLRTMSIRACQRSRNSPVVAGFRSRNSVLAKILLSAMRCAGFACGVGRDWPGHTFAA